MTLEQLKSKLEDNFQKLLEKFAEWEASLQDVVRYKAYMKKIIRQFKQTNVL